jgi:hypothetical protein
MKIRIEDSAEHFSRLAFAQHLFTKGVVGNDPKAKPAYSSTFIVPNDHPVVAQLKKAEEQVAKEKWGEKAPAILKSIRAADKGVYHDGDSKAQYDGFEGNTFISTRSDKRPNVYNRDGSQLNEEDGVVYSGCYAHGMIEVWAQDNSWGKRINAQLTGVMFSRDGDSFGGGASPAAPDDFADLSAADEDGAALLG